MPGIRAKILDLVHGCGRNVISHERWITAFPAALRTVRSRRSSPRRRGDGRGVVPGANGLQGSVPARHLGRRAGALAARQWIPGLRKAPSHGGEDRPTNPARSTRGSAALLASFLVHQVTFMPRFLFTILGAPYVERLRQALASARTGISPAVVGVIANLAVFFVLHNHFKGSTSHPGGPIHLDVPGTGSWNSTPLAITAIAIVFICKRKSATMRTLSICAVIGLIATLAFRATRYDTSAEPHTHLNAGTTRRG